MIELVSGLHVSMGPKERARWIAFAAAGVADARRKLFRAHVVESGYPVAVFDDALDDIREMRRAA